ncbi:SHOCT domain-containing protein [bacterium]|nr:SHOCT domain-containing protein [bacterium]MBU1993239.1 SHOCT domain-containing protein [bacterium]
MKKIFITLGLIFFGILFTACAKIPFKEQAPLENAALVYIYVMPDEGINDTNRKPSYKVSINNKQTKGVILMYEYMVFNLKPSQIDISATRADIETKTIRMDLKAGETYYLRVQSFSDDFAKFELAEVASSVGKKEIRSTDLAGSVDKQKEEVIEEILEPLSVKSEESVLSSTSKTDEIQKAYKLKEQGIISEEEFNALKAEILAK